VPKIALIQEGDTRIEMPVNWPPPEDSDNLKVHDVHPKMANFIININVGIPSHPVTKIKDPLGISRPCSSLENRYQCSALCIACSLKAFLFLTRSLRHAPSGRRRMAPSEEEQVKQKQGQPALFGVVILDID
jgi:hypothetical protein